MTKEEYELMIKTEVDRAHGATVNVYQCEKCCKIMITVDRDLGVTPFTKVCEFCKTGSAVSQMYRVPQTLVPAYEWYRPSYEDFLTLEPHLAEHVKNGGLLFRPIEKPESDQKPLLKQPVTVQPSNHIKKLTSKQFHAAVKYIAKENSKFNELFVEQKFDVRDAPKNLKEVWRNNRFLVQVYDEGNQLFRLSVNRTKLTPTGDYESNISWEDLQQIKNELGFAGQDAVEIYPSIEDVVNVANMRHLWVFLEGKLPFGWRSNSLPIQENK